MLLSLPARGAWIEIPTQTEKQSCPTCRSPHGERGLKYFTTPEDEESEDSRSPHGERGLKLRWQACCPC